jgi:hypothetical protein
LNLLHTLAEQKHYQLQMLLFAKRSSHLSQNLSNSQI